MGQIFNFGNDAVPSENDEPFSTFQFSSIGGFINLGLAQSEFAQPTEILTPASFPASFLIGGSSNQTPVLALFPNTDFLFDCLEESAAIFCGASFTVSLIDSDATISQLRAGSNSITVQLLDASGSILSERPLAGSMSFDVGAAFRRAVDDDDRAAVSRFSIKIVGSSSGVGPIHVGKGVSLGLDVLSGSLKTPAFQADVGNASAGYSFALGRPFAAVRIGTLPVGKNRIPLCLVFDGSDEDAGFGAGVKLSVFERIEESTVAYDGGFKAYRHLMNGGLNEESYFVIWHYYDGVLKKKRVVGSGDVYLSETGAAVALSGPAEVPAYKAVIGTEGCSFSAFSSEPMLQHRSGRIARTYSIQGTDCQLQRAEDGLLRAPIYRIPEGALDVNGQPISPADYELVSHLRFSSNSLIRIGGADYVEVENSLGGVSRFVVEPLGQKPVFLSLDGDSVKAVYRYHAKGLHGAALQGQISDFAGLRDLSDESWGGLYEELDIPIATSKQTYPYRFDDLSLGLSPTREILELRRNLLEAQEEERSLLAQLCQSERAAMALIERTEIYAKAEVLSKAVCDLQAGKIVDRGYYDAMLNGSLNAPSSQTGGATIRDSYKRIAEGADFSPILSWDSGTAHFSIDRTGLPQSGGGDTDEKAIAAVDFGLKYESLVYQNFSRVADNKAACANLASAAMSAVSARDDAKSESERAAREMEVIRERLDGAAYRVRSLEESLAAMLEGGPFDGHYEIARPDGERKTFDSEGRLQRIEFPEGDSLTFEYAGAECRIREIRCEGHSPWSISFPETGPIRSISGHHGPVFDVLWESQARTYVHTPAGETLMIEISAASASCSAKQSGRSVLCSIGQNGRCTVQKRACPAVRSVGGTDPLSNVEAPTESLDFYPCAAFSRFLVPYKAPFGGLYPADGRTMCLGREFAIHRSESQDWTELSVPLPGGGIFGRYCRGEEIGTFSLSGSAFAFALSPSFCADDLKGHHLFVVRVSLGAGCRPFPSDVLAIEGSGCGFVQTRQSIRFEGGVGYLPFFWDGSGNPSNWRIRALSREFPILGFDNNIAMVVFALYGEASSRDADRGAVTLTELSGRSGPYSEGEGCAFYECIGPEGEEFAESLSRSPDGSRTAYSSTKGARRISRTGTDFYEAEATGESGGAFSMRTTSDALGREVSSVLRAGGETSEMRYEYFADFDGPILASGRDGREETFFYDRAIGEMIGKALARGGPLSSVSYRYTDGDLVLVEWPGFSWQIQTYDDSTLKAICAEDGVPILERYRGPKESDGGWEETTGGICRPLLISTISPSGLVSESECCGLTAEYSYDGKSRVTEVDYGNAFPTKSYSYGIDLLKAFEQGDIARDFQYDSRGRVLLERTYRNLSCVLRKDIQYSDGPNESSSCIDFSLGAAHYPDLSVSVARRKSDGRIKRDYGYGGSVWIRESASLPAGGSPNASSRLDIPSASLYERLELTDGGATAKHTTPLGVDVYRFDGLGRLVAHETPCRNTEYSYDGEGNILSIRSVDKATGEALSIEDFGYARTIHSTPVCTGTPSLSLTYSESETVCLLPRTFGGFTVGYDSRLLISSLSSNAVDASYSYDFEGRRVAKTVNNDLTEFFYDEKGRLAYEDRRSFGRILYLYDGDLPVAAAIGNGIYVYHYDLLGNIDMILSQQGDIIARYRYSPFGKVTVLAPDGVTPITDPSHIGSLNAIRYKGYYYDSETSLYCLGRRYYSPALCRFLVPDDLEMLLQQADSYVPFNFFAYCNNNPIMYSDNTGRSPFLIALLIGIGLGAGIGSGINFGKQLIANGNNIGTIDWLSVIGSGLLGGALGAVTILGGAAGLTYVGAQVSGYSLSAFASFAISSAIGAAGNVIDYSFQVHGNVTSEGIWEAAWKGTLKGATSFVTSFIAGTNGLFVEKAHVSMMTQDFYFLNPGRAWVQNTFVYQALGTYAEIGTRALVSSVPSGLIRWLIEQW